MASKRANPDSEDADDVEPELVSPRKKMAVMGSERAPSYGTDEERANSDSDCSSYGTDEERANSDSDCSGGDEPNEVPSQLSPSEAKCKGWSVCQICAELVKEESLEEHGTKVHRLEESTGQDRDSSDGLQKLFNEWHDVSRFQALTWRSGMNIPGGIKVDDIVEAVVRTEYGERRLKKEDAKSLSVYVSRRKSLLSYADFHRPMLKDANVSLDKDAGVSNEIADSTATRPIDTPVRPEPPRVPSTMNEPFTLRQLNEYYLSMDMLNLIDDYKKESLLKFNKQYRDGLIRKTIVVLTLFTPDNDAKTFRFQDLRNIRYMDDQNSIYYLEKRFKTVAISASAAAEHLIRFKKFIEYLQSDCKIEVVRIDRKNIFSSDNKYGFYCNEIEYAIEKLSNSLKDRPCVNTNIKKNKERSQHSQPLDHILILHSPLMLNFVKEFTMGKIDEIIESNEAKLFYTSLMLTRIYMLQGKGTGALLKMTLDDFKHPVAEEMSYVTYKIGTFKETYIHLHHMELGMVLYYLKFIRPGISRKATNENVLFLTKRGKSIDTYKMNLKMQAVAKVALKSYQLIGDKLSNKRMNLAKKKIYCIRSMRLCLEEAWNICMAADMDLSLSTVKYQHKHLRKTLLEESLKEVRNIRWIYLPEEAPCNWQGRTEICDTMVRFVAGDKFVRTNLSPDLWNELKSILVMSAEESEGERFKQLTLAFEENS